jgi:hypothetical protein
LVDFRSLPVDFFAEPGDDHFQTGKLPFPETSLEGKTLRAKSYTSQQCQRDGTLLINQLLQTIGHHFVFANHLISNTFFNNISEGTLRITNE